MTNRRYERGLVLILFLWLACCFKANAQVAVTPAPVPKLQFLDTSGRPLAGGKVCTFSAGTVNPLTTYSESTGSSANTNPITLDSGGFANIFLTSAAYKFIIYSSVGADSNCPNAGVSQYSVDGINPGALGNTAITGTLSVSGAVTLSSTLAVTTSISVAGGTALTTTNSTGTGSLVKATAPTVTNISSDKYTSTVATGTAPLVVASTTPVANLTTGPATYNAAGSQLTNSHIVVGSCTLGTDCAVTLAGAAVFTGTSSYFCSPVDTTAAAAVRLVKTSGSVFTFTGTGTDVLNYVCAGN